MFPIEYDKNVKIKITCMYIPNLTNTNYPNPNYIVFYLTKVITKSGKI